MYVPSVDCYKLRPTMLYSTMHACMHVYTCTDDMSLRLLPLLESETPSVCPLALDSRLESVADWSARCHYYWSCHCVCVSLSLSLLWWKPRWKISMKPVSTQLLNLLCMWWEWTGILNYILQVLHGGCAKLPGSFVDSCLWPWCQRYCKSSSDLYVPWQQLIQLNLFNGIHRV